MGLGETEMEVLRHVWDLGEASVSDVHKAVNGYRIAAYSTILTVLRKLSEKGYLTYEQKGAMYVYRSAEPAGEMQGKVLQSFVNKVFGGSHKALIQTMVEQGDMDQAQRDALISMIEKLK